MSVDYFEIIRDKWFQKRKAAQVTVIYTDNMTIAVPCSSLSFDTNVFAIESRHKKL